MPGVEQEHQVAQTGVGGAQCIPALGLLRKRTGDTDLNWPQKWYIRLGYAVLGTIVWPFVK